MLDLDNSTHIDTRAEAEGVNTTVRPEVVRTTDPPALDVEEDVNMTMPSTAVSVPDSVKEFTEADLKLANITGEI